ncbi:response regulator, partial [Spirulina subsalsa FACHB-351]
PQPVSTKTLRLELEQLEHINHLVGELLINQNQLTLRDEQFQGAVQKLSDWLKKHRFTLTQLRDYIAEYKNEDQKKLTPTQRLLYSAIEETSQITQATEDINLLSRTTTSTIEREKRISKQLRDNIQSARMVPLKTLLKRFPPMVKQLSFVHKKEVELTLKGTEVMVDKTITENLYDALLHLIRNAFDHGIESPEIRQTLGKPTTGQLEIYAYNQGNRTIIEVRDDGQGLNVDKICQKALSKGLITEVESERIKQLLHPEDRLIELMSRPGFSTADQVSDLSGRGVGLDVVQTQLANIKGYLSVRSFPQQGTIFYVQIRESLMSARLLICRAKNSIYGFVSNEIEQVLIPGDNLRWLAGQKVLDWQQKGEECTIPVYELASLFHYSGHSLTQHQTLLFHESSEQGLSPLLRTPDNVPPVLLLRTTEGLIGLEVDQVIEEQELVIKPISSAIAPPPYLYGCSILADGRLTLILDGAALLQQAQKKGIRVLNATEVRPQFSTPFTVDVSSSPLSTQQLGLFVAPSEDTTETEERRSANIALKGAEGQTPSSPTPAQNTILVVDDSLTERQTLTLILQRNGYKVIQSKDGLEALEALKTTPEVKMILCDIEMPRMNGLEFLSRLQQDKTLAHPPIVMLTSRSRDKFQHIAMSLGAYAYLTKPYLEQEILSTLEEAIHELIPPTH